MSVYLEQFYQVPETMLDNTLTTIQEFLFTGKNPIYEMTLLQWLLNRHATFTSLKQMKVAIGISNLLINAELSDYLQIMVSFITSSFKLVHVHALKDVVMSLSFHSSLTSFGRTSPTANIVQCNLLSRISFAMLITPFIPLFITALLITQIRKCLVMYELLLFYTIDFDGRLSSSVQTMAVCVPVY